MSLKNQLESLLFSSGKAMEEEQLASLTDASQKDVKKALKELQADYVAHEGALKVYAEGTAWKLLIKDDYVGLARRIVADTELTRATLETLAVICAEDAPAMWSKMARQIEQGDLAAYAKSAHAIKGLLSTFETNEPVCEIQSIIDAARDGDEKKAKALHSSLHGSVEKLIGEIDSVAQSH